MLILLSCSLPGLTYPPENVVLLRGVRYRCEVWCIRDVLEVPNSHDDPDNHFGVLHDHITSDTIGAIHSHPDDAPFPSNHDLRGIPFNWIGAVYSNDGFSWYTKDRPANPRVRELRG